MVEAHFSLAVVARVQVPLIMNSIHNQCRYAIMNIILFNIVQCRRNTILLV